MRQPIVVSTVLLNGLLCAAGSAQLQANLSLEEQAGWEVEALIGVENEPAYAGSDVYQSELDGDLSATWRTVNGNEYFIGLGEIGARLPFGSDWLLSTALEYEAGRDNSDDPILRGFRDVEDTVEGQAALIRRLGDWSLGAVFQPDVLGRGKGIVYFLGIGYTQRLFGSVELDTTWDVSWGNSEHMDTEFGINADESLISGLSAYRPASGLKSTTVGLQGSVPLPYEAKLVIAVAAEHYLGAAAASPLINTAGSDVTYEAGLGIAFELY